jgi:hypothetical protein
MATKGPEVLMLFFMLIIVCLEMVTPVFLLLRTSITSVELFYYDQTADLIGHLQNWKNTGWRYVPHLIGL